MIIKHDANCLIDSRHLCRVAGVPRHRDFVRDVIRNHLSVLESAGDIHVFSTASGEQGGRPCKYIMLNPEQAVLAVSLMKNTEKNIALKAKICASIANLSQIIESINEFEVPDDLPDMYVYAIRESETGRVKIGISRDPKKRLSQLQTGNSQKLELVAYKRAENRFDDERAEQLANASCHIRGEWFSESAVISA